MTIRGGALPRITVEASSKSYSHPLMGPATRALMGSVCWTPRGQETLTKGFRFRESLTWSLNSLSKMLREQRKTKYVPCHEGVHFTSIIQFYLIHMHTTVVYSYGFLDINFVSVRCVNPQENATGTCIFYISVMSSCNLTLKQ